MKRSEYDLFQKVLQDSLDQHNKAQKSYHKNQDFDNALWENGVCSALGETMTALAKYFYKCLGNEK